MATIFNTEIGNLALSHLGMSHTVTDLENEQSIEAKVLRRFYEPAMNTCLRDFPWPFATGFFALGLVEEQPNEDWGYSYRYPSECLHVRRILGQSRNDTRNTRVPYKIGSDNQGKLIYTDQQDAEIELTKPITDSTIMTDDFKMAFSFLLAHYAAPSITKGDPNKLGARAKDNYLEEISSAKSAAVNEEQVDNLPESEFVRGRI